MRPGAHPGAAAFPRLQARTQRFTLGLPRTFAVAPDGSRVTYLRSASGEDPVHALWVLDMATGRQRCVADPAAMSWGAPTPSDAQAGDLPPEERARRERLRESGGGITAYATDRDVRRAVFALGGRLHWVALDAEESARAVPDAGDGVFDPRLSPDGEQVAFVRDRCVWTSGLDGPAERLVGPEPGEPQVSWGAAEFVAAEEMGRTRGFWWSPDSRRLAVARVDESPVARWHVADPANPQHPPQQLAYPAAGTANALVALHVVDRDGRRTPVDWDAAAYPYLADVAWGEHGPLTLVVQSRDQRRLRILRADPETGATELVREQVDSHWVELVGGVPRWLPGGRLLHTVDEPHARRLAIDGVPVGPPDLQVRHVIAADGDEALTAGGREPTAVEIWRIPLDGSAPERLGGEGGVAGAARGGPTTVLLRRSLDDLDVHVAAHGAGGVVPIAAHRTTPPLPPNVELLRLGDRGLRGALLLPHGHSRDDGPLPVLLDPYGGPHAQRVLQAADALLTSQWFAEQGFAVLVVDGRGSPGRGPAWEKAVAGDLAGPALDDQVDALAAASAETGVLDLARVAIRGWSFGGYLAALAVLRRPDVFHAAVAGAPVTDWSLYDTHYTERYLGMPGEHPQRYRNSSLVDDAAKLSRPLLLIHGLADDNVVAAHTLRLSAALLEAGRPHEVLPLPGVTHMTPQEAVAENLLRHQLDFLRRALVVN